MTPPLARLSGIVKRFGPVTALDGAELELGAGEVHGVLGENGAGKTTLLGILAGMLRPDSGTVEIGGEARRLRRPGDAWAAGVGMVHQHFTLVPALSVLENLALGRRSGGGGLALPYGKTPRRGRGPLRADGARGAPGRAGRGAGGGKPAARRDPQGAPPPTACPGARRADGGARARGGRRALRSPARDGRRGTGHRARGAQARRGAGRVRPRDRAPARPNRADGIRPGGGRAHPGGGDGGGRPCGRRGAGRSASPRGRAG